MDSTSTGDATGDLIIEYRILPKLPSEGLHAGVICEITTSERERNSNDTEFTSKAALTWVNIIVKLEDGKTVPVTGVTAASNPSATLEDRAEAQKMLDVLNPTVTVTPVTSVEASPIETTDQRTEPDPDAPGYKRQPSKRHEGLDSTIDLSSDQHGNVTLRNCKSPLWNEETRVFDRKPQPDVTITANQFEALKGECKLERQSKNVIHYDHERLMTDKEWIAQRVRIRRMLTEAGFKGHEL